jgi:hypothetical protein
MTVDAAVAPDAREFVAAVAASLEELVHSSR